MIDIKDKKATRSARLLTRTMLSSPFLVALMATQAAHAQGRVVSACSGASLPASEVTRLIAPIITGIAGPTETTVNGILAAPVLGVLPVPQLNLNATGLLAQAAAGNPITLQVLATDGTIVGPTDQCRSTSDSITLDTPAGVAIGGNQITGLGANGAPAFAGDIDAVAFGNNARAEIGATASLALGANSSATAANSVALGAGSVAARGALAGYTAAGLTGTQASAGEVSVGAPGALRQITNVAAGSAASDAATVGQVGGVLAQVGALRDVAVQYDGTARDRVTLGGVGTGAGATTIANLAPGTLAAGSTEAVNGAQLFATNQAVGGNTNAITALDGRVTTNTTDIANLRTTVSANTNAITTLTTTVGNQPLRYANAATPTTPNGGTATNDATLAGADAGPVGLHNVRAGVVAAGSTDAVNGGQLAATNLQVAANTTAITNLNAVVAGAATGPVRYSNPATPTTPNGGIPTNDVTLVGANGAATVAVHNIAAGAVTAASTDAVNGQQLYATSQVAQQAATVAGNSVQYGPDRTSVTFTNPGNTAVSVRNVAAGTAATDAVNVGQLQSGMQSAIASANAYTDTRLNAALSGFSFDLAEVKRDLGAGTSAALAAAALPQPSEPGRTMIAIGGGTYRGQTAIALGASTFLDDGHSMLRLGATYDSRGYGGANAGYGYQF